MASIHVQFLEVFPLHEPQGRSRRKEAHFSPPGSQSLLTPAPTVHSPHARFLSLEAFHEPPVGRADIPACRLGDFRGACANTGLESPVNLQAGKPALERGLRRIIELPGLTRSDVIDLWKCTGAIELLVLGRLFDEETSIDDRHVGNTSATKGRFSPPTD